MRFDQEKYFLEVGVGGKIPTSMVDSKSNSYGGAYFDLGGDYYLIPGNVAWYLGGGVIPGIILSVSSNSGVAFGLAPYIQTGVMMPRMSKTAFYAEIRVAQHIMPISAGYQSDSLDIYGYTTTINSVIDRKSVV
jgi:hypothetical protein